MAWYQARQLMGQIQRAMKGLLRADYSEDYRTSSPKDDDEQTQWMKPLPMEV